MTAIEDPRAVAQDALEFYRTHPDSPAGYLASALETLLAEHERLTAPPTDDAPTAPLAELDGGVDAPTRVAPTDDEREALARTVYYWDVSEDVGSKAWEQLTENQRDVWREAADAILAAGFRRQGPITDTPAATVEVIDERHPECVKAWPECESFGYDPRCCRFPKSCSAGVIRRDEAAERARTAANDNSRTHCKECREGKHGACDGSMYVEDLDVFEVCGCAAYDWNGEHTAGGGS